MSVRIIRAAECPEVPWKNGGGTTREIAVFPPGAGMDDFLWRLSMARVETPGAFSPFAGIERTLAVLEGALRLRGEGVDIQLDPQSAPFVFDGGARISGEPLGGPVLDLNAMVRRGAYGCTMTRLSAGAVVTGAGTTVLVMLEPQTLAGMAMDTRDCAVLTGETVLEGAAIQVDFYR